MVIFMTMHLVRKIYKIETWKFLSFWRSCLYFEIRYMESLTNRLFQVSLWKYIDLSVFLLTEHFHHYYPRTSYWMRKKPLRYFENGEILFKKDMVLSFFDPKKKYIFFILIGKGFWCLTSFERIKV